MSTQIDEPDIASNASRSMRSPKSLGWRLPLYLGLACALVGFLVATLLPKMYRVNTTVYFPSQGNVDASSLVSQVIGKGSSLLGGKGGGGAGSDSSGSVSVLGGMLQQPEVASGPETAIAVLDSTRCREAVAADLNLQQVWHFKNRDAVLDHLQSVVTYGIDKNGLLAIEVDDSDPHLAMRIAQSYLDNLRSIATDLSTGYSHQNRLFLESELARQRAKLLSEEKGLVTAESKKGYPVVSTQAGDKLMEAFLDLESQKTQAQVALAGTQHQIDWTKQTANLTIQNSMDLPRDIPVAQDTRNQLRNLEAQFAYAKETLGPDNPQYKSLQLQLDTARSEMRAEVNREAMALKNGISPEVANLFASRVALQAENDGLDQAINRMQKVLADLPTSQMRETQMQGDIKIDGDMMGMLATETERARIAEERDNATFVVVDVPEIPEYPYSPKRGFVTLICFVAGIMIGFAWMVAGSVARMSTQRPILMDDDE